MSLSNGSVVIDGALDTTTSNVVELAYVSGRVWQKSSSNLWWSKTSYFDVWTPTNGTSIAPL